MGVKKAGRHPNLNTRTPVKKNLQQNFLTEISIIRLIAIKNENKMKKEKEIMTRGGENKMENKIYGVFPNHSNVQPIPSIISSLKLYSILEVFHHLR